MSDTRPYDQDHEPQGELGGSEFAGQHPDEEDVPEQEHPEDETEEDEVVDHFDDESS